MSHQEDARYGLPLAQWECARGEMRDILRSRARERRTITYGELADRLGAVRLEPRSRRFAAMLNDVCTAEAAEGRPMLGSLVIRADATGMPGKGYFRVVRELGCEMVDERGFWESELESVYRYWADDA